MEQTPTIDNAVAQHSGTRRESQPTPAGSSIHDHARDTLTWLVVFALLCALWFVLLEHRVLWDPDEGRYAEIPREMIVSGDWLTPRLNDLYYFEKPPLQYWASAASYELFGMHNWSARLWTALTGLAGVLVMFYAGLRLYSRRVAVCAAAMLASSPLYFVLAHVNTLDMGLTFFTEILVLAIALGLRPETGRREATIWIHLAWIAAALAVLSKGLIGIVLPAGALGAYSILYRDFSLWKRLSPLSGGALFLIIAAPWFVAMSVANPDFAHFFFIHEHFTRFLTNEHHRGQPWWFFLPVLAVGVLPWIVPMLRGLWRALRQPRVTGAFDERHFFALWVLVVLAFFSASGSKLVPYILPLVPILALLGARELCETRGGSLARDLFWSGLIPAGLFALGPVIVGMYPKAPGHELAAEMMPWVTVVVGLWTAGALLASWAAQRGRLAAAVITFAAPIIASHQVTLYAADAITPARSSASLARQIAPRLSESTHVYTVSMYPQSLPFYLGRTVTLVNFRGEFDFGLTLEPAKGVPTIDAFIERWTHERDAVAVMSKTTYRELASRGVPMRLIGEDVSSVAIERP